MSWQPIETAPKDGTTIDILSNGRRRVNYRFDGDFPYPAYSDASDARKAWRDRSFQYAETVTHWMPLPEPPSD